MVLVPAPKIDKYGYTARILQGTCTPAPAEKKDESVDHCARERKNTPEHGAGVGARSKGHQLA